MDIKSYAISIIHDQIYGPDTVAIKYAGRGFYIFKTSGTAILEFKDRSLTPYTEICMKAYGYIYSSPNRKNHRNLQERLNICEDVARNAMHR